jgi:methylmalonyl-CoA mutase N-terminal domain/subunit
MTPEIKEAVTGSEAEKQRWEAETLAKALEKTPERKKSFEGVSLEPVERLYTDEDSEEIEVGFPGEFPYKRGIHPTGYRGRLWTMRQFAGFSSPENTNARFKYLMEHGQTGLSVAYDLPALMGLDADSPLSEGEVGKCGVAVSSLADFEVLFDGIPLDQVTVSQTINAPAPIFLAMYLVVAEKQKADFKKISGTLQNDILKEYIAQKEVDLSDQTGDQACHRHVRIHERSTFRNTIRSRSAVITSARRVRRHCRSSRLPCGRR